MKRFTWSLDRLLALREFHEKQAEIELGHAISKRDLVQSELEDTARKRMRSARSRVPGLSVHELLAIEHYIRRLDADRDRLLEELAAAELRVEQKREAYIKASRDRNALTRLREKKESDWRKKYLTEEASSLDDIAASHDRNLKMESSRARENP